MYSISKSVLIIGFAITLIPILYGQDIVLVEAESFAAQTNASHRSWTVFFTSSPESSGKVMDETAKGASSGAYVHCIPDTRITHDDKLVHGINFCPEPGTSVLHYPINFDQPGRYYVWVRAFSRGTEDNGIHVGVDGLWPKSGKRMQWCDGKHRWTWESKQRTEKNHCGEPGKIYLDIATPGEHTIQFSMREDGFAFDQFILATDSLYVPDATTY